MSAEDLLRADLLREANDIVCAYYDTEASRKTRFEGEKRKLVLVLCKRIVALDLNANPDKASVNLCKKLAMKWRNQKIIMPQVSKTTGQKRRMGDDTSEGINAKRAVRQVIYVQQTIIS
jgi:hypothetical protein